MIFHLILWAILALIPPAPTNIQYVSASGNDTFDGLTWATAKATIWAALETLPGGSAAPPTAGHGTVFVGSLVPVGAVDGGGLRFVGPGSTEYANPATGWVKMTPGGLTISCMSGTYSAGNSHQPGCIEQWGKTNLYPALQVNGSAQSLAINSLIFQYQGTAITLGIDSSGNRNNGGAQNIHFTGVSGNAGNTKMGYGPQVDIGSNVFWVYFDDDTFYGTCDRWNVSLARTAGTSTATVLGTGVCANATHDLLVGAHVSIRNQVDTSFNGSYVVASIPDSTHFTFAQPGSPDATLATAAALGDKAFSVVLNPGSGQGMGMIAINRMVGTGIKFYSGTAGGSVTVSGFTQEGTDDDGDPPGVWFACGKNNVCGGYANHIEIADSGHNASAVVVDQGANPENIFADFLYTGNGACLHDGPMTVGGAIIYQSTEPCSNQGMGKNSSVFRSGARGVVNGLLSAQADDARRIFGPVMARFPNLAPFASSSWVRGTGNGGTATVTTGIPAPDGTLSATHYAMTGGTGPNYVAFVNTKPIVSHVGDYFIFGSWTQSASAGMYANGNQNALTFFFQGTGNLVTTTYQYPPNGVTDGEWDWPWGIAKVTAVGPSAPLVSLVSYFNPASPVSLYAPVLIHVPAGTLSDNEAFELALHLQTYRSDATPGQISTLPGAQFKADSLQVGPGAAPIITSGTGLPVGSCPAPAGCIYLRMDAAATGPTLFVYEGGGWVGVE